MAAIENNLESLLDVRVASHVTIALRKDVSQAILDQSYYETG